MAINNLSKLFCQVRTLDMFRRIFFPIIISEDGGIHNQK